MCGFLGVVGSWCELLVDNAWADTSWRGDIEGAVESADYLILATRLPRKGNRLRPQPIRLPSGDVFVLNGEIYNALELLNAELGRPSATCRPFHADMSDAEMIAACLLVGADFGKLVAKFRGEYAVAYVNHSLKKVMLARDRMGSRPLFWSRHSSGKSICFGSRARSVSVLAGRGAAIDQELVFDTLEFGLTQTASVFAGIDTVPPGALASISQDSTTLELVPLDVPQPLVSLQATLEQAVRDRSADGGGYVAFSGGVDSSVISLLAPGLPRLNVSTSSRPSKLTNTVRLSPAGLFGEFIRVGAVLDRPISTLSAPAMSLLAKVASQRGFEVQLSGEGGDELFLGYPHLYSNDGSSGHPSLRRAAEEFSLVKRAFDLESCPRIGSVLEELTFNSRPREWSKFDRWTRLPQHLTLVHSDLPGLLNRIESRLPFLDACSFDLSGGPITSAPKEQLRELLVANSMSRTASAPKRGLNVKPSLLGQQRLLVIQDALAQNAPWPLTRESVRKLMRFTRSSFHSRDYQVNFLIQLASRLTVQMFSLQQITGSRESRCERPGKRYTSIAHDFSCCDIRD